MKLILLVKYCIISLLIYSYYVKFITLSKIINSFSKLKPLKLFIQNKFKIVRLVRIYKSSNIIGIHHLNRCDFLVGKKFLVEKKTSNVFLSTKERVLVVNNKMSCGFLNLYSIDSYFWCLVW